MTRQPQVGDVYEYRTGASKGKRIRLAAEFVNHNPFPRRSFETVVVHHPFAKRMIGYTSHVAAYRLTTSQFRLIEESPVTTTPTTFRKKPVEIQAMLWDGSRSSAKEIIDWVMYEPEHVATLVDREDPRELHIAIETLEGRMKASPGDWIIRGVEGEFYPCKPDTFAKTYDTVPTEPTLDEERATRQFFTASEDYRVVALRERVVALGAEIYRRVPEGRQKSIALTALEDVQMRANRGIFAPEGN